MPVRRSLAALALAVVLPLPGLLTSAALANVVVKQGDTLSEIADRNGISLKRLMQANGLTDPSKLAVGQSLVIPGGGRSSSAGPSRASVQPAMLPLLYMNSSSRVFSGRAGSLITPFTGNPESP